jgi:hypothetical protein
MATLITILLFLTVFYILGGHDELIHYGRSFLLFSALINLIFVGFMYLSVFTFGFTNVARYGLLTGATVVLLIGSITQILISKKILPSLNVMISTFFDFIMVLNPVTLIVGGLVVYTLMMILAARTRGLQAA